MSRSCWNRRWRESSPRFRFKAVYVYVMECPWTYSYQVLERVLFYISQFDQLISGSASHILLTWPQVMHYLFGDEQAASFSISEVHYTPSHWHTSRLTLKERIHRKKNSTFLLISVCMYLYKIITIATTRLHSKIEGFRPRSPFTFPLWKILCIHRSQTLSTHVISCKFQDGISWAYLRLLPVLGVGGMTWHLFSTQVATFG